MVVVMLVLAVVAVVVTLAGTKKDEMSENKIHCTVIPPPLPKLVSLRRHVKHVNVIQGDFVIPSRVNACIGTGMSSCVYAHKGAAIKLSRKNMGEIVLKEGETHWKLRDVPGIVPILSYGTSSHKNEAWLATKLMHPIPTRLNKTEAIVIGQRIFHALTRMHEHGYVHGDIAVSNMLFDGRCLTTTVLSDLGNFNAHVGDETLEPGMLQREPYRTPFLVSSYQYDGGTSVSMKSAKRSDIYALACVLIEATTGISPWRVSSEVRLIQRISHEDEFTKFIQSLLLG